MIQPMLTIRSDRDRRDLCPGALRPWPAEDGLLVRLRIPGGIVTSDQLESLLDAAEQFGDSRVRVTVRSNLQVRAFPGENGQLAPDALAALLATGLVPVPSHDLVRNIMVSPQTGIAGGRADLRSVVDELDKRLCSSAVFADIPGRFLFALDDGRGDLMDRQCDLGLAALDAETAQLRIGDSWGSIVDLGDAAQALAELAEKFLTARGTGPSVPWHVEELDSKLAETQAPDPRLPAASEPLAFGLVPGGRHVEVPPDGLGRSHIEDLIAGANYVIVTRWNGIFIPEGQFVD